MKYIIFIIFLSTVVACIYFNRYRYDRELKPVDCQSLITYLAKADVRKHLFETYEQRDARCQKYLKNAEDYLESVKSLHLLKNILYECHMQQFKWENEQCAKYPDDITHPRFFEDVQYIIINLITQRHTVQSISMLVDIGFGERRLRSDGGLSEYIDDCLVAHGKLSLPYLRDKYNNNKSDLRLKTLIDRIEKANK